MNTNKRSRYLSAAVSAVLSFAAATAGAGPQNGTVTSGAATISTPAANITQIDQATNSVSIDWQSFDVAANEKVLAARGKRGVEILRVGREGDTPEVEVRFLERLAGARDRERLEVGDLLTLRRIDQHRLRREVERAVAVTRDEYGVRGEPAIA